MISSGKSEPESGAESVARAPENLPNTEHSSGSATAAHRLVESEDAVIAAPAAAANTLESGTPAEIPPDPSTAVEEAESDEEEDEYEYEEDDDAPFVSGFLVDNPTIAASRNVEESAEPATICDEEEEAPAEEPKMKWREPTREAVSMSLRAEKETTGSKRRLAQDLYRIMNEDTEEAGFSLQPSSEDSMDKWTIKLFKFDEDSNLAKDMLVLGLDSIELEMSFPDQYPFEPPFVRVVRPRFRRQTGFVMNGALCMELLTSDGWRPTNDISSTLVSIRSLLVVGDGRLEAACSLGDKKYEALLAASTSKKKAAANSDDGNKEEDKDGDHALKRQRKNSAGEAAAVKPEDFAEQKRQLARDHGGSYTASEAQAAYSHLSDYHKKKGWDSSGWWSRKG